MNVKSEICNAFNLHASEYQQAAKVQYEIGERLFERLHYLKIKPRYVLDLGCGPGFFSQRLKQHYPKAQIIGFDLAYNMLALAKSTFGWRKKWPLVNGDMTALPFADATFDLIFANQVIHWANPLAAVVAELNRVMNPNGCLMFSTLGPDTFLELRQAFATVDQFSHVNDFMDMHDIGDCLLREYFLDPVVDMEKITAHYPTLNSLLKSLKAQGVRNIHATRNPGLTGKSIWSKLEQSMAHYCTPDQKIPLTYEVVYGHAWKGNQRQTAMGTETIVSIDQLRASVNRNKGII